MFNLIIITVHILLFIHYVSILIYYINLYKRYKNMQSSYKTLLSLYQSDYKDIVFSYNQKMTLHNQITLLNHLVTFINENKTHEFYKEIYEQLYILYELRSLSSTPYYELNYMLCLYKIKLIRHHVTFHIVINPILLADTIQFDFCFCISYIIEMMYKSLKHNNKAIYLYITQKKQYIECIIKTNNSDINLCHDLYHINHIIKRYDGTIISFHDQFYSGYKFYIKTSL